MMAVKPFAVSHHPVRLERHAEDKEFPLEAQEERGVCVVMTAIIHEDSKRRLQIMEICLKVHTLMYMHLYICSFVFTYVEKPS